MTSMASVVEGVVPGSAHRPSYFLIEAPQSDRRRSVILLAYLAA